MYQDAEKRLEKKNARITKLEGLGNNEICDWIKAVKNKDLSTAEINFVLEILEEIQGFWNNGLTNQVS